MCYSNAKTERVQEQAQKEQWSPYSHLHASIDTNEIKKGVKAVCNGIEDGPQRLEEFVTCLVVELLSGIEVPRVRGFDANEVPGMKVITKFRNQDLYCVRHFYYGPCPCLNPKPFLRLGRTGSNCGDQKNGKEARRSNFQN